MKNKTLKLWTRVCAALGLALLAGTNAHAQPTVATLGGGSPLVTPKYQGYRDGATLTHALFRTPAGLALDSTGQYLYVADRDNNAIRYLDLTAGQTWTFGVTFTNLINKPIAVAVDSSDNVYVLNRGNGTSGSVITFDNWGDAVVTNAVGLSTAAGLALDSVGNIYVTIQGNKLIRIAAGTTNRTTIATIPNAGTSLQGIVVKHNGLIAACDSGRNGIYLITTNGVVTTNAGFHGTGDFTTNGNNIASSITAKFNQPMCVAEAGDGTLIVTDYGNNRVKAVLTSGVVTNLYGVTSQYWGVTYPGWYDGAVKIPDSTVPNVQSRLPFGVVMASDGSFYTSEDYYHIIRKVTGTGLTPPPPSPPTAPTILTVTTNYGQVTLTWSAVTGATNYNVKRSPSSGGPYTTIASTNATSYTDTTDTNGTTYYYVVSASNAGGEGANSLSVSATPPLPPANTISFGFASGPGSSKFVASPGQTFVLPVSLSLLLNAPPIYGLQFNVTLTNLTSHIVNPATIDFGSLLGKPDTNNDGYYQPIQPWMFVSASKPNNDTNVFQYQGGWYQSLQFANTNNENLLGVGWLEVLGRTNLYNTLSQNLLTYPIVDGTDSSATPNQMVIGAYGFDIPINASPGDVYQIQIGRPSGTTFAGLNVNPYGTPVAIEAPVHTNLLGSGSVNALKNVTIGQIKYLVGSVYPANWYNAGDFGSMNLANIDVIRVFDFAAYPIASPPVKSDLFDALDSCGNIGVLDGATGYLTNTAAYPYFTNYPNAITNYTDTYDTNGVPSRVPGFTNDFSTWIYMTTYFVSVPYVITNIYLATPPAAPTTNVVQTNYVINVPPGNSTLFNYNDTITNINQIAFGDDVLDVCDVYVTFRRSLDPSLTWYQRYWTNGVRVAEIVTNVVPHALVKSSATVQSKANNSTTSTNSPQVNFSATNILASAGQTIQVPITAQIFGAYPLRVLMLNLTVTPLDGSPALTTPVQFIQTAPLGASYTTDSKGNGNYSAVWLNSTIAGLTGTVTLGTLTVTIPAGASANAAYAVHFDHASASPNGLASFPKQTLTGLLTLSSRTNSSYGDGIPDSWRLRWFGTVNNLLSVSNACPTGDGINNWKKYVAGVDPNVANDFPSVNPKTPVPSGSTTAIHWPTVSGKQYAIERSASLFPGSWTTITTNTGTGTDMEFDDSPAGQTQFYRVRILP
jgi:VCBS repeat-containing protein